MRKSKQKKPKNYAVHVEDAKSKKESSIYARINMGFTILVCI